MKQCEHGIIPHAACPMCRPSPSIASTATAAGPVDTGFKVYQWSDDAFAFGNTGVVRVLARSTQEARELLKTFAADRRKQGWPKVDLRPFIEEPRVIDKPTILGGLSP